VTNRNLGASLARYFGINVTINETFHKAAGGHGLDFGGKFCGHRAAMKVRNAAPPAAAAGGDWPPSHAAPCGRSPSRHQPRPAAPRRRHLRARRALSRRLSHGAISTYRAEKIFTRNPSKRHARTNHTHTNPRRA
jgi:hypothetical protein